MHVLGPACPIIVSHANGACPMLPIMVNALWGPRNSPKGRYSGLPAHVFSVVCLHSVCTLLAFCIHSPIVMFTFSFLQTSVLIFLIDFALGIVVPKYRKLVSFFGIKPNHVTNILKPSLTLLPRWQVVPVRLRRRPEFRHVPTLCKQPSFPGYPKFLLRPSLLQPMLS